MDIFSKIVSINLSETLQSRQYGGKSTNLSLLAGTAVNVPSGVAIGKDVFAAFLSANGVDLKALDRLHTIGMVFLENILNEAECLQKYIIEVINTAPFPPEIEQGLRQKLGSLSTKKVAVRSSCVVEDGASISFAGQYVTLLRVTGMEEIFQAIRECWESQYKGRGIKYSLARRGMPVLSPSMGILIQEMIEPDFAGVCFTQGPTRKTKDFVVIESVPGCGEALVSGEKTPSHFEVDKSHQFVFKKLARDPAPSDSQILSVISEAIKIASVFDAPQDVEWAIKGDKVYILQTRPITVLGGDSKANNQNENAYQTIGLISQSENSLSDESPFVLLRDDLHEWLITQVDPTIFRGATYILSSQKDEGCWSSEGNLDWAVVTTAMVVQVLLEGGISPTLQWSIPRDGNKTVVAGMPNALTWLVERKKADNTWGTDLWDTCQVINTLIRTGKEIATSSLIKPSIEIIKKQIESETSIDSSEWFGAGFYAAALILFKSIGDESVADQCRTILINAQESTGDFCGPRLQTKVPSEWHTSQAISALAVYKEDPGVAEAIDLGCQWLISRQQVDGSWGVPTAPYSAYNILFTSYAMMALSDAGYKNTDAVARALKFLKGKQIRSGAFSDLSSSLMAMSALQKSLGPAFTIKLPIPVFFRIQMTLGEGV